MMLSNGMKRGFSPERLKRFREPKVHKDEGGYYIYTINENVKVYFEDYYKFLESAEKRCLREKKQSLNSFLGLSIISMETPITLRLL